LHLGFEEGAMLRVQRREPVLVDQHGLVRQPRRPAGLADVLEHPLAQLARPGHEIEPLAVALLVFAENGPGHGSIDVARCGHCRWLAWKRSWLWAGSPCDHCRSGLAAAGIRA